MQTGVNFFEQDWLFLYVIAEQGIDAGGGRLGASHISTFFIGYPSDSGGQFDPYAIHQLMDLTHPAETTGFERMADGGRTIDFNAIGFHPIPLCGYGRDGIHRDLFTGYTLA